MPEVKSTTPFQEFCGRWKKWGCGSGECPGPDRLTTKVCLLRGSIPCDILFIGEAPGESENAMGYPFVGPAGKLLDRIVGEALSDMRFCSTCRRGNVFRLFPSSENPLLCDNGHTVEEAEPLSLGFTNLVGCIPRDDLEGGKASEPEDDQVKACAGRLVETVELCSPKLIVCVGRLAKDWLDPEYRHNVAKGFGRTIPTIDIVHPASILRANQAQRGLMIQRSIVVLRNGVRANVFRL